MARLADDIGLGSRSASTPEGVEAIRFDVPRELRAVLFIPELRLSTAAMRRAQRRGHGGVDDLSPVPCGAVWKG